MKPIFAFSIFTCNEGKRVSHYSPRKSVLQVFCCIIMRDIVFHSLIFGHLVNCCGKGLFEFYICLLSWVWNVFCVHLLWIIVYQYLVYQRLYKLTSLWSSLFLYWAFHMYGFYWYLVYIYILQHYRVHVFQILSR